MRKTPVRKVLLALFLLTLSACSSEKTELTRATSPDGGKTAVVMQEAGGGAAISSTYFLYISDGQNESNKPSLTATYCGGLSVAWKGSGTLLVQYDSECYIREFVNKWWSKSAIRRAQSATVEIVLIRSQDKSEPQ
jgi:hypothetical protein